MNKEDNINIDGVIKISTYTGNYEVRIMMLFVVEKFRRKGIGSQLLDMAEKYIYETWPCGIITMLVIENNPMESFLIKHGYEKAGTYRKFIFRGNKFFDQSLFVKRTKVMLEKGYPELKADPELKSFIEKGYLPFNAEFTELPKSK